MRIAGQQHVQQHADGVNIRCSCRRTEAELFRCGITDGSNQIGVPRFVCMTLLGGVHVEQLNGAVFRQNNVGRFDIPMDNGGRKSMQLTQDAAQLTDDIQRLLFGKCRIII